MIVSPTRRDRAQAVEVEAADERPRRPCRRLRRTTTTTPSPAPWVTSCAAADADVSRALAATTTLPRASIVTPATASSARPPNVAVHACAFAVELATNASPNGDALVERRERDAPSSSAPAENVPAIATCGRRARQRPGSRRRRHRRLARATESPVADEARDETIAAAGAGDDARAGAQRAGE